LATNTTTKKSLFFDITTSFHFYLPLW
jgi:hypothetical protein